jgi:hypothetical protein
MVNIFLLNLEGKAIYRDRLPVTGSYSSKTILVPRTAGRGMYFLVVQGERSARFEKIVLQ